VPGRLGAYFDPDACQLPPNQPPITPRVLEEHSAAPARPAPLIATAPVAATRPPPNSPSSPRRTSTRFAIPRRLPNAGRPSYTNTMNPVKEHRGLRAQACPGSGTECIRGRFPVMPVAVSGTSSAALPSTGSGGGRIASSAGFSSPTFTQSNSPSSTSPAFPNTRERRSYS